ncbi:MAG: ATP--dephospho-CoA triphosphoribosyl transferase CitG [Candidatus Lokiarchaeota archaeon]|nr:ATP--dephospho-CoA triphosphoribosyl transferase CitG [Candidatus Lokiarchaeota archaeon]MBD3202236.1 ATP--dephospho-CoA triphosphoribosyl transferase CitG [Candidatus Lokiarchaeota archaeon]
MVANNNLILSVKSVDDVVRCLTLSSLLEVSGFPKPGNVHRTHDFMDTRFEHFLSGIVAIQPDFLHFCEKIITHEFNKDSNFDFIELGLFFKAATESMMKWQSGGNILLGHILLLPPLAGATIISLKINKLKFENFRFFLEKIIRDSTVEDTINLYKAIRTSNPGGLGTIDKYDLNDENSISQIIEDGITLKEIFNLSQEYDMISRQYATNFKVIFEEGLPYFLKTFKEVGDINSTIVNTYLKILSLYPDTLIIRKSGYDAADKVQKFASEIITEGGITTETGKKMIYKFDKYLQQSEGKLNPGTTADLVAGVIFCALIFGVRF